MGVCGACVDTTDKIRINYEDEDDFRSECNVTAPGGINLTGPCNVDSMRSRVEVFTVAQASGEVFSSGKASLDRGSVNIFADFAALGIPRSKTGEVGLNGSLAAECAFWYCVQSRRINVQRGTLFDEIVMAYNKTNVTSDDAGLPPVADLDFRDIPGDFLADSRESYGAIRGQTGGVGNYLNESMQGSVFADYMKNAYTWSESDLLDGLFESFDDIGAWKDRVAKSMTNEIRSRNLVRVQELEDNFSGGNGGLVGSLDVERDRYRGTAMSQQVTIIVHWGWMAYPAVLVAIALVYLAVEAVRTARMEGIRPWKDDPLVPLYLQLDDGLRDGIRAGLEHPDGTDHVAGNLRLHVAREDNGFPEGFHFKQE